MFVLPLCCLCKKETDRQTQGIVILHNRIDRSTLEARRERHVGARVAPRKVPAELVWHRLPLGLALVGLRAGRKTL